MLSIKKFFAVYFLAATSLSLVAMDKFDALIEADKQQKQTTVAIKPLVETAIEAITQELKTLSEASSQGSLTDTKKGKWTRKGNSGTDIRRNLLLDKLYYLSIDGIDYAIQRGVFSSQFGSVIKSLKLRTYDELKTGD